jgi:hypothetical protein
MYRKIAQYIDNTEGYIVKQEAIKMELEKLEVRQSQTKNVDLTLEVGANFVYVFFKFLPNNTSAKILITTPKNKKIDEKLIFHDEKNNECSIKFTDLPYGDLVCVLKLFKNDVEI